MGLLLGAAGLMITGTAAFWWLRRQLRVVTVHGDSMRPTLAPGDRLLVRRAALSRVRSGDIIVLAYPERDRPVRDLAGGEQWLIKRAAAVPGDSVPAAVAPVLGVPSGSLVGDGVLIALGDNLDASYDSRSFGYVPAEDLLGVVLRPIRVDPR